VGDTDELLGDIEEFLTGSRAVPTADRVLATILSADIVASTSRAASTGDRHWRDLLNDHDRMARQVVLDRLTAAGRDVRVASRPATTRQQRQTRQR
jgi:class 3 adenylate cyclase